MRDPLVPVAAEVRGTASSQHQAIPGMAQEGIQTPAEGRRTTAAVGALLDR